MKKAAQKRRKMKRETNPNKVNQYTQPDPRQTLFLALYHDPKSETFSNAYQSAVAVGYSEEYAANLKSMMPTWLSENIVTRKHEQMLAKAERNLDDMLDFSPVVPAMGPFGPIFEKIEEKVRVKGKDGKYKIKTKTKKGNPIMVVNSKLLGIKMKTTEFVAETIGRARYGRQPDAPIVPVQINFNSDKEAFA